MNTTPPPGWYPDNASGEQRWWDGRQWTQHTAPGQPQQGPGARQTNDAASRAHASSTSQPNWIVRHKIISAASAFVVALMVIGALAGSDDEVTPTASNTSSEAEDTGADPAPIAEPEPVDSDGDGMADDEDVRPDDPAIQTEDDIDTDKDGVPDFQDFRPEDRKIQTRDDVDTDKDGVADYQDAFPKDAQYSKDTDGDGVADQLDAFPRDAAYSKDTDGDRVADSVDAFPQDSGRWKITLAMENALESAHSYLDMMAFSRQGLIDQLSSEYGEGYSVGDATWAVDQTHTDWNKEAVESAKSYLDMMAFSRQGLIDQLSSAYGEQFTLEQAIYAVNKIGL